MARPVKLNSACAERIVAAVRTGASHQVAAQAAGIGRSTLQAWLAKGETADAGKLYRTFAEAVREAEAAREVEALGNIRAAARGDWRAEAWWLQHGPARERYAKLDHHQVSGGIATDGGSRLAGGALNDPKVREALRNVGRRIDEHRRATEASRD